MQNRIVCVIVTCLIAVIGFVLQNFFFLQTEDKNVVLAHVILDFNVGTVKRCNGQGSVEHEFHVGRAGCFLCGR